MHGIHGFSTALRDLENRRRIDRRALGLGLALSLALHLLLLGIPFPSLPAPDVEAAQAPSDRFGTRLVVLPTAEVETPERLAPPPVIPDPVWTPATTRLRSPGPEASRPPSAAPASAGLRASPLDARLTGPPATAPSPADLARGRFVVALDAAPVGRSTPTLRNAALASTWEDSTDRSALAPGRVTVDGVTIPFCGGTDAARCGFGALPWDLETADRWTEYLRGVDAQIRWMDRQERAQAIRTRSTARDTLDAR